MPHLFILLLLLPAWTHAQADEPAVAGVITLKLGGAWITNIDGERRPADADAPIHIGDRIETDASGHAHIRFRDDGVVSIRPDSLLTIEDYRPPAGSEPGAIRFKLEHGTARSITGRWGEQDHSRFRLNTPIAGIGIQGTDFIVQTENDLTRVTVQSGAVVAAPLGDHCAANALGPCTGPSSIRLTGEMRDWMIEIHADSTPSLRPPRSDTQAQPQAGGIVAHAPESPPNTGPQDAHLRPTLTAPPATTAEASPFAWGHWAQRPRREGDTLTVTHTLAAEGRERVAENDYYALYRQPQTSTPPSTGAVTLGLVSGQASLITPTGLQAAQVKDGWLNLDFSQRKFSTGLTLDSTATGPINMTAAGVIQSDGALSGIDFRTRIRGAWAEGGERGLGAYIFEHSTAAGMYSGIGNFR